MKLPRISHYKCDILSVNVHRRRRIWTFLSYIMVHFHDKCDRFAHYKMYTTNNNNKSRNNHKLKTTKCQYSEIMFRESDEISSQRLNLSMDSLTKSVSRRQIRQIDWHWFVARLQQQREETCCGCDVARLFVAYCGPAERFR